MLGATWWPWNRRVDLPPAGWDRSTPTAGRCPSSPSTGEVVDLSLDLTSPSGRGHLDALAATADVVLACTPSGSPAGGDPDLDLDLNTTSTQLAQHHPQLVVVSMSGAFGAPVRSRLARTDLTVWASSGAMALCGDPDRAPARADGPPAFLHAGAQAAGATVIALVDGPVRPWPADRRSAQATAMQATPSAALNSFARCALGGRSGDGMGSGDIVLRFVYPASTATSRSPTCSARCSVR